MEQSTKFFTFLDFMRPAGLERYTKSLIEGLSAHYPDYALIVVNAMACANNGCRIDKDKNLLDNFRIAFAFEVPVIIIVSKIDLLSNEEREEILDDIYFELRN